ncbi:MAG: hypothetical protein ACOYO1_08625 [Bacteroidales bacterium]
MKNKISAFCAEMPARFIAAPVELSVFFIFALLVSILSIGIQLFGSVNLKEFIVPITGWSSGLSYPYCVLFVFILIFRVPYKNYLRLRNLIVFFLIINIVFGSITLFLSGGVFYSVNPYLRISIWQPVWTMFIPACWALMFFSPRIKKYCESLNSENY